MSSEPIAIIGLGCRLPRSPDHRAFWNNLIEGLDCVTRGEGAQSGTYVEALGVVDHTDRFDADYFGIASLDAAITDPQQRLLLQTAATALQDAGYGGGIGGIGSVFVGTGENLYYRDNILPRADVQHRAGAFRIGVGNEKDFAAPRIAHRLGLTGPSVTLQTGCASSLAAVSLACQSLQVGDCDLAIAGAASLLTADARGYEWSDGGVMAHDGFCRAFDARASGAVPASGVAVVVLKRLNDALEDGDHCYAVVRGHAMTNDGAARSGFAAPSVSGQEAAIRLAQQRAEVSPSQISFVETHGTGTALGDPIEIEALTRAFGAADSGHRCALGAVKTSIGHTDAAAGVVGLIKTAMSIEAGVVPKTLHHQHPHPDIRWSETPFYVSTEPFVWSDPAADRVAGVSSVGIGGTNVHVVVSGAPQQESPIARRSRYPLLLSARSESQLKQMMRETRHWLSARKDEPPTAFADMSFTLSVGRSHEQVRWAVACHNATEAEVALSRRSIPTRTSRRWRLVVPEESIDWAELLARLLTEEPLYVRALEEMRGSTESEHSAEIRADAAGAHVLVLTVLALRSLGFTPARLDLPGWAHPVAEWFSQGGEAGAATEAVRSAKTNEVPGAPRAGERATGSALLLNQSFDLASAAATVWAQGCDIDWIAFFSVEPRLRISAPTYAFAPDRHWVETPLVQSGGGDSTQALHADGGRDEDVAALVLMAWKMALGVEMIDPNADFVDDLNGDSVVAAEIGADLRSALGINFPIDLPLRATTLSKATEAVLGIVRGTTVGATTANASLRQ